MVIKKLLPLALAVSLLAGCGHGAPAQKDNPALVEQAAPGETRTAAQQAQEKPITGSEKKAVSATQPGAAQPRKEAPGKTSLPGPSQLPNNLPSPAVVQGKMEAIYYTCGKPIITVGSEPFALHFVDVGNKYDREIDVQVFVYGIERPDCLDPKVEYIIWEGRVKPGELIHLPPLVFPKESEDLMKACLADTSGVFGTPFFMARVNGYVSEYIAELARSVKQLNGSYEIDYGDKKVIRNVN